MTFAPINRLRFGDSLSITTWTSDAYSAEVGAQNSPEVPFWDTSLFNKLPY